jgi:hypothetical protein
MCIIPCDIVISRMAGRGLAASEKYDFCVCPPQFLQIVFAAARDSAKLAVTLQAKGGGMPTSRSASTV